MINLKTNEWEINNIETVLFDKDGTFIDLHFFWGKMTELRVEAIINEFQIDKKHFNKLCLCLGYNRSTQRMLENGITALYSRPKIIEIFKNDLKNFNVKTTDKKLEEIFDKVSSEFYKNIQNYIKPINDAIEFIKELRKKEIKIGIVTSDAKESTILTLKHFNWEELFDTIIGRESTQETKESGIPTKMALELLNSNPQTTIMIGDAPMDYISAKNASIEKTILVSSGQIAKEKLKKISFYTVETLKDIELF